MKTYNIKEASLILGVTPRTIYRWKDKGYILFLHTPSGSVLISESELRRFHAQVSGGL
jgi:excisionase family DNA binding protein